MCFMAVVALLNQGFISYEFQVVQQASDSEIPDLNFCPVPRRLVQGCSMSDKSLVSKS